MAGHAHSIHKSAGWLLLLYFKGADHFIDLMFEVLDFRALLVETVAFLLDSLDIGLQLSDVGSPSAQLLGVVMVEVHYFLLTLPLDLNPHGLLSVTLHVQHVELAVPQQTEEVTAGNGLHGDFSHDFTEGEFVDAFEVGKLLAICFHFLGFLNLSRLVKHAVERRPLLFVEGDFLLLCLRVVEHFPDHLFEPEV